MFTIHFFCLLLQYKNTFFPFQIQSTVTYWCDTARKLQPSRGERDRAYKHANATCQWDKTWKPDKVSGFATKIEFFKTKFSCKDGRLLLARLCRPTVPPQCRQQLLAGGGGGDWWICAVREMYFSFCPHKMISFELQVLLPERGALLHWRPGRRLLHRKMPGGGKVGRGPNARVCHT